MNKLILVLLLAAWAERSAAADLSIVARDENNEAIAGAVVMLIPRAGKPPAPIQSSETQVLYEIAQKDLQFAPHILAVPKGQSISFPNLDTVRHQVFSFSKAKRFVLNLYGRGVAPRVTFEEKGVVAIGCNIHDNMKAYVYVHDAPYSGTTNDVGSAMIHDVLSGDYLIQVWHPRLKSRAEPIERIVTVLENAPNSVIINLPLRPMRRPVRSSYH